MTHFPDRVAWRAACDADPVLATWRGPWEAGFAIDTGTGALARFGEAVPAFTFVATSETWARYLEPVPPRHHHSIFAMLARVPGTHIEGDQLAFRQHVHRVRRVLEIGKWLALGHNSPAPVSLRPSTGVAPVPATTGAYVEVRAREQSWPIYYESTGSVPPILCLHTAGADGRQFHRLMAEPRVTSPHRLVTFDLPWHGKSPPPAGAVPSSWRLDTELYVELIMGFVAATGLTDPIVLGASMSGEICLELALRYPDAFRAIIACEACERIEGRQTHWPLHPAVNAGFFVPEWIEGLMAPQSPAECAAEVLWHYAQGGPGVFYGDIAFYSGDWDARGRIGQIDARRAGLFMLTGEYDYSCTTEMSEATATKIPGVRFQPMTGIGHFPFAENPARFLDYLLPILSEV